MKFPRRLYTTLCTATVVTLAVFGLVLIAGSGTAKAGSATGISGSTHDFSGDVWNFTGEICRTCHTPHDKARAAQLYLNGLLWNHQVSSATYTMYNSVWSDTLDNTVSAQPDGIAKLCLSCHDGTVGLNQFDAAIDAVGTDFVGGSFQIPAFADGGNRDLRGTHPISIAYNGTDTGLNPDSTAMGTSGTIADVLDKGKVQCHSCHDVHDEAGEAVAATQLLRVAQTAAQGGTASGLCLTCHNK